VSENTFEPIESGTAAETAPPPARPTVTFMGNTYDLASLGALISGSLLMFMCLTCNQGIFCLPFVPIVVGVIGLLSADQAVDAKRTKLWSWLGVGMGGAVLALIGIAVLLYVALFVFVVIASGKSG